MAISSAKQIHGGRPSKPWQLTTFFFSHFPYTYGERDMLKIFHRWGRVEEVFISRKLNRWGNRFGFVRFCDVKNVPKLETELDSIRIGSILWTVDCFQKVLGKVGTLIDVDETTLNWECVEFARLKVRLAVVSTVHICEEVWINDRVYQISVEEEYTYVDCKQHKWLNEDVISESSSAMESRVGDSLLSLDDELENVDVVAVGMNTGTGADRGRSSSDHKIPGQALQRGGSEVQSFLENSQTLADYRDGQVEGCMKMVTLVQPNSFVKTMSKDQ